MTKISSLAASVMFSIWMISPASRAESNWVPLGDGIGHGAFALIGNTNDHVYVGGFFTNAGGVAANNIAKWDGTSWTNLGSGVNNAINVLTIDATGQLYAGGWFEDAGGVAVNHIAKWDGTSWTNLGSGMNSIVNALVIDNNGQLYAGGWFTNAGGVAAQYVAKWNGTSWTNLGNGMNLGVNALAIDNDGQLYAGGYFTNAGGMAANRIAKWNGTMWTNLGSGMNSGVVALACSPGDWLYAGGWFTDAGGITANRLAKWNGTTWTNLGSGMNGTVTSLYFSANYWLYVGGRFTNAGGVAANNIAKWHDPYSTMGIHPSMLSYTATYGEANPAPQIFVVSNQGPCAFDFTSAIGYGAGATGWFNPTILAGTVAYPGSLTVTANVSIAGLNVGTYTATNTISSATASNSPQTVVVTLTLAKGDQEIVFPAITDQAGTNTVQLSATASSGLPVTFEVVSGPAQLGGSNLSFTGTGLVTIVARQGGDGNWNPAAEATNTFHVTTVSISLSPPTGISASDGEFAGKVRLTWYPVTHATAYEIWRHTANAVSGAVQVVEVSGGDTTTYEDTSANPDVIFFYWIRAKAAGLFSGLSEFSNSEMGYRAPTASTLNPPGDVSASDGIYTNKVRITHGGVTGAGTYEIWKSTVNLLSSAALAGESTNTVYDDAAVTPNVSYYYWIRAKNPIAVSGFSLPNSGYAALGSGASGNADLALVNFLFLPTVLSAGDSPGAVSAQLVNYGPADLANANTRVTIDFYLSANTNYGDTDDIWFGDYGTDLTLSAGVYTTLILPAAGRQALTIPAGIQAGNYQVFARVHHSSPSTLTDPDMTNNVVMRPEAVVISAMSMGYHLFNDYDGDGKSDLAVYEEASGKWEVMLSGSEYHTASIVFGGAGYAPVLADYDGDGKSDPAVYQENSGTWSVKLSGNGYATTSVDLGGEGCTPVPADFDGDGKSDPTVYRESNGEWQIILSGSDYDMVTVILGGQGSKAVPMDYDGDGKSDLAVYRRSTGDWVFMLSTLNYWTITTQFGEGECVPVPADFDGDGKSDPAVYKESQGEWRVMMSQYNYIEARAIHGGQGYLAMPADYDGDGKEDIVVYNEMAGELRILMSGSGYGQMAVDIGGPGYEPVGVVK